MSVIFRFGVVSGQSFAWIGVASWMAAMGPLLAEQEPAQGRSLFRDFSPTEFRKLEAAKQQIDPGSLQEELLSAAIFHETNRRRAEQKLPALRFHEKVRAASLQHARQMAKGNYLSHGTPKQPESTTPSERLAQQSLQPRFSAENVAFNFVLRYEAGKPFHTRKQNGRTVYSYEPGGKPIEPHTYVSFAEAILTQWMNSPAHRKNIVAAEPEFLAVGCALSRDEKGIDIIYADQDFFTPL